MPRFKHYNYDQNAMVVINYQEQLQPGIFEHAVHYLIEHKLNILREHGPTPEAFTFKKAFPAPDELGSVPTEGWDGECPAS